MVTVNLMGTTLQSVQHQRHRVFEVKLILTPITSEAVKTKTNIIIQIKRTMIIHHHRSNLYLNSKMQLTLLFHPINRQTIKHHVGHVSNKQ